MAVSWGTTLQRTRETVLRGPLFETIRNLDSLILPYLRNIRPLPSEARVPENGQVIDYPHEERSTGVVVRLDANAVKLLALCNAETEKDRTQEICKKRLAADAQ